MDAFTHIFQQIEQLKAEHRAIERRNLESLKAASVEIEKLLQQINEDNTDDPPKHPLDED